MSARSEAKVVVQQGTKYHIFMSLSTTTHIASDPLVYDSPVIMSIEILAHSFERMDRDFRILAGGCCKVELYWQV
jgi:hypothetical protein